MLSSVTREVAQAALNAAQATDGLVSPLVLEAIVTAGYDRSFEALPRLPEPSAGTTAAGGAEAGSSIT